MTDYKKLYEDAIFRINKWVEGSEIIDPKEVAEFVFPELKESDDEKIRKAILELVRQSSEVLDKQNQNNMIAWLEKQKTLTNEEFEQGKNDVLWCIKQAKKYAKDENEFGTCWFAEQWLEKQGEKLPVGFYYVDSNGNKYFSDTFKNGNFTFHVEKYEQILSNSSNIGNKNKNKIKYEYRRKIERN
ncbi:MAG: hypothetical protein J6S85_23095 [Methanobrevibacter sp.]|nr:hypothetical protein [Methanobrevibacter sp.]